MKFSAEKPKKDPYWDEPDGKPFKFPDPDEKYIYAEPPGEPANQPVKIPITVPKTPTEKPINEPRIPETVPRRW